MRSLSISRHIVGMAATALAFSVVLSPALSSAQQPEVDCSEQLQQVPRDGSTVSTTNLWLTYSGSMVYGGVATMDDDDVRLDGPVEETLADQWDYRSVVGTRVESAQPGDYQWQLGEGPQGRFSVSPDARVDDDPPRMGEGEIEVDLELVTYEEFPVLYRHWKLSFPAGEDDQTDPVNLRYLVVFEWNDGEEKTSRSILVTPPVAQANQDRIAIELGGRADRCHHQEPDLPVTEEAVVEVWAVDLAGNISDEPLATIFEGVSAEKLARAHEEFHEVIATLGDDDEESMTTEEVMRQMEAEEEQSTSGGRCAAVGAGGGLGTIAALLFLGLVAIRSRK